MFKFLFEKIISLDLPGLNLTFHFSAHLEIFSRSLFNIAAVSAGSLPIENNDADEDNQVLVVKQFNQV